MNSLESTGSARPAVACRGPAADSPKADAGLYRVHLVTPPPDSPASRTWVRLRWPRVLYAEPSGQRAERAPESELYVPQGGKVAFGRGSQRAIRLGHDWEPDSVDPAEREDLRLSRHAGLLEREGNRFTVTNTSSSQLLQVLTPNNMLERVRPGGIYRLQPGANAIVQYGKHAEWHLEVMVNLEAHLLTPPDNQDTPTENLGDYLWQRLTPAQRRALFSLCEPLLASPTGRRRTPLEVSGILGVAQKTVYNSLYDIRLLYTEQQVPGLRRDTDSDAKDFQTPLAHWAVDHGVVTQARRTQMEIDTKPTGASDLR